MQKTWNNGEFLAGCEFRENGTAPHRPRIFAHIVHIVDGVNISIVVVIVIPPRSMPFVIDLKRPIRDSINPACTAIESFSCEIFFTGTWSPPSLVNGSNSVESRRAKWLSGSEPSNVNGSSDMVDDVRLLVLLPVFRISATDTFERKSKRNQTKADTWNQIQFGSKQEHKLWCHSIEVGDHTPLYSTDNSSNARRPMPDISCSRKKRNQFTEYNNGQSTEECVVVLPFGRHLLLLSPFFTLQRMS